MKRTVVICLAMLLALASAMAAGGETNIKANRVDAPATPAPEGGIPGFVIDTETFFTMESSFQQDFTGNMSSITLFETQTLLFDPAPVDRLLPTLAVTITPAEEAFVPTTQAVSDTLGSLIEVM